MPDAWKPPDGFTLTQTDPHYLDSNGRAWDNRPAELMPDGQINVFWFGRALDADGNEIDVPPWAYTPNDGRGPNATAEARERAAAGDPIIGWNPVYLEKPIMGGYVPPQSVLVKDDDPTLGAVEPATTTPRDLTPEEEVERLRDAIDYAEARIAEIGGSS